MAVVLFIVLIAGLNLKYLLSLVLIAVLFLFFYFISQLYISTLSLREDYHLICEKHNKLVEIVKSPSLYIEGFK